MPEKVFPPSRRRRDRKTARRRSGDWQKPKRASPCSGRRERPAAAFPRVGKGRPGKEWLRKQSEPEIRPGGASRTAAVFRNRTRLSGFRHRENGTAKTEPRRRFARILGAPVIRPPGRRMLEASWKSRRGRERSSAPSRRRNRFSKKSHGSTGPLRCRFILRINQSRNDWKAIYEPATLNWEARHDGFKQAAGSRLRTGPPP